MMKKMVIMATVAVVLIFGSIANAAVFSFDWYADTWLLDKEPLSITDAESGVTATFSGFKEVNKRGFLTDYEYIHKDGATISFDRPMKAYSLDIDFVDTSYHILTYFLNGVRSYGNFDSVHIEFANFMGIDSVEAAPTPLPGAVWLLGSGLVGLAGIRRKMKR